MIVILSAAEERSVIVYKWPTAKALKLLNNGLSWSRSVLWTGNVKHCKVCTGVCGGMLALCRSTSQFKWI